MPADIVKQLDPIFKPKSIAFIGASNDPGKWGHRMLDRALNTGYRGKSYAVNNREKVVQGLNAYPSVLEVPDDIDLAVITVPAPYVPGVLREAVGKGVKGAIVISAGFAEAGNEGRELQEEAISIANDAGIRFVGPNCMGIWSSAANLNLCFQQLPKPGPISFVSQSGTLGGYLFEVASEKGYGFSKFISSGNQANLSAADYIEYLGEDQDTKAIVLYLEGIPQGRRFLEVSREVIKKKPIAVYKGGRTQAGARATLSHTASLAGADEVFEAVCKQVGLLRGYEALDPFDMAEALTSQPIPKGKRVAIIANGGGYCVTTSDACASLGLEIPEFGEEIQRMLYEELLPHAPAPLNPVDTAGDWRPLTIARLVDKIASLDCVDGIITSPSGGSDQIRSAEQARLIIDAAELIANVPKKYGKPVVTISMRSRTSGVMTDILKSAGIPGYETPEECARGMYALMRYGEVKQRNVSPSVQTTLLRT